MTQHTSREYKLAANCTVQLLQPAPGSYGPATRDFRVVRLIGHLDANNYAAFHEVIVGTMAGGVHRYVFDLSALKYISSAGVGVLIAIYKDCDEQEGWVKLCGLAEHIGTILSVLKVTDFIPEYPTLVEALEAVKLGKAK